MILLLIYLMFNVFFVFGGPILQNESEVATGGPQLPLCLQTLNHDFAQCKSIEIVTWFHPIKVLIHKILTLSLVAK